MYEKCTNDKECPNHAICSSVNETCLCDANSELQNGKCILQGSSIVYLKYRKFSLTFKCSLISKYYAYFFIFDYKAYWKEKYKMIRHLYLIWNILKKKIHLQFEKKIIIIFKRKLYSISIKALGPN